MLYETGRVVAVDGDGLWVETLKQSACGKCAAKTGCGQKLLNNFPANSNMTLIKAVFSSGLPNENWQVGDQALLGIDRHALVQAALISYLVPLILMLLGVVSLSGFFEQKISQEVASVAGALIGLFLGAGMVRLYSYSAKGKSCYQAQVVGRALVAAD